MESTNSQVVKGNGVNNYPLQYSAPNNQLHFPQEGLHQDLKPRIDVRLDYENLHITLKKDLEWKPDAQALIKAVKEGVKHLGEIVRIVAYADWDKLSLADRKIYPKWHQRSWQRDLAAMGVETRYLVNEENKNVVDIQMTNDIRDLLERRLDAPDAADLIILGTNDSDFSGVLEAAKRRRRKVVLLAVKGQLSQHLQDIVDANDVYYIDQGLHLHQIRNHASSKK
jgi:uncharacterized LabA/DUF88 family protein